MAQWESDWLEVAGPSLTRCNMFCPWARQLILCLVLVLPRKRPDMTEKLLTRRKFQLKKIKKHHIKKIKIKKSKIKKKSANEIMHQSGKINFIMICQKGVPQKKRDPTKFIIKQQTLFHWVCSWELPMESTSAFQGPQHGGHIGQKTLVILMKKSNNNIY